MPGRRYLYLGVGKGGLTVHALPWTTVFNVQRFKLQCFIYSEALSSNVCTFVIRGRSFNGVQWISKA